MSNSITFDVTLASKIKGALIRNHIPDAADLDWLAAGDNIMQVRKLRLGTAELVVYKYIVDLDADPLLPEGWTVYFHRKGGQFEWCSDIGADLYADKSQGEDDGISGHELFEKLKDTALLNANLLDFLGPRPHLIPESWKSNRVTFWGTVFQHRSGPLCVYSLEWNGHRWRTTIAFLNGTWGREDKAALETLTFDLQPEG